MHLMDKEDQNVGKSQDTKEKWDGLTEANKKATTEVIGYIYRKMSDNTVIIEMSKE